MQAATCYIAILTLIFRLQLAAASCSGGTVYSPSGTISCQSSSSYMSVSWTVQSSGVKMIKFTKLDVNSCCDRVSIYENTSSALESTERFRLRYSDVIDSELWLTAPFVVRFQRTGGSRTGTGFELNYQTRSESIPAAAEIIRQNIGVRKSHPGDEDYANNYRKCWSIFVPSNYEVLVQFTKFITQQWSDKLNTYRGLIPHQNRYAMLELSGNRSLSLPFYKFQHSVTFIFSTDSGVVRSGFEFKFSITAKESRSILSSKSGVVSYLPGGLDTIGKVYDSNFGIMWTIDSNLSVIIKFSRLQLRRCCDSVRIYERITTYLNSDEESFRVNSPDSLQSEFWLTGPVVIRFVIDRSITDQGFRLTYETSNQTIPGATEVIRQKSGSRITHPQVQSAVFLRRLQRGYRKYYSLVVPQNFLLKIRMTRIDENRNSYRYGSVRIFNGTVPNSSFPELYRYIVHGQSPSYQLQFNHSVILAFVNSVYRLDFRLTKNHAPDIRWDLSKWTTSSAAGPSFAVSVTSVDNTPSANCRLHRDCGGGSEKIRMQLIGSSLSRSSSTTYKFLGAIPRAQSCYRTITCKFDGYDMANLAQSVSVPKADPEHILIDVIQAELWHLTGVIQFRAVSESACPSATHRCELRTASNDSSLVATLMKREASRPRGSRCLSSVTSQFVAVFRQPSAIAGSVIRCRLFNGTFALLRLPEPDTGSRLARVWERPLLCAASSLAAVASIALLGLACKLFNKTCRPQPPKAGQEVLKMQRMGNQYTGDSAEQAFDATGVYVT